MDKQNIILFACVVVGIGAVALFGNPGQPDTSDLVTNKPPEQKKVREFDSVNALVMCQQMLANVSKYPDKADIPYVDNQGTGDGFAFSWGRSTKHMMWMNGLGQMVPTSGFCLVSKSERKIKALSVNGKTIL